MSSAIQEGAVADRIVLSYRAVGVDPKEPRGWTFAGSEWIQEGMGDPTYLGYLRRAHEGEVVVGEEWEEFVSCGCASPQDVIIRVEEIEGGTVFGEETAIEIRALGDLVEQN